MFIDPGLLESINDDLVDGLSDNFLSPENGIQLIRRVLAGHGFDMPALYGADPEGDETVIEIMPELFLYLIYSVNENGQYEFYAELTDDEGLDELLSDEDDEEIA